MKKLSESLIHCKKFIEELEGPLYDVALLDLQAELAYPICFKLFHEAVQKRFHTKNKQVHYLKLAIAEIRKSLSI
ncbi:MAG: hypothetical protein SNF33_05510 [Candidatus Algichlamydia australiensis]|nr:hypothetical protein [Chlamydiales bacterium]